MPEFLSFSKLSFVFERFEFHFQNAWSFIVRAYFFSIVVVLFCSDLACASEDVSTIRLFSLSKILP
jgi:hypothetical protein